MRIKITRVEGFIEDCGKTIEAETFAEAKYALFGWSLTAPQMEGTYHKCDFEILFEGELDSLTRYDGRFDLEHYSLAFPDLKRHMVENAEHGLAMLGTKEARKLYDAATIEIRKGQLREILHGLERID